MIAPLRARHRMMVTVLAVVVPVVFAVALLQRQPEPLATSLPPGVAPFDIPATARQLWQQDDLWQSSRIQTTLHSLDQSGQWLVQLQPLEDLRRPDVLLYAGNASTAEGLSGDERLLGRLAGTQRRAFELQWNSASRQIQLTLFSLAHGEVVDRAQIVLGEQ